MKFLNYAQRESLLDCASINDGTFFVCNDLHFDMICVDDEHWLVSVFDAEDCCNITYAHSYHYSETAHIGTVQFDSKKEAAEYMSMNLLKRSLYRKEHDADLEWFKQQIPQ